MLDLAWRIWKYLERKRKREAITILLLMLLSSILEVISIGLVIPFLSILSNPNKVLDSVPLGHLFSANTPSNFLMIVAITFAVAVIVTAISRLLLLKMQVNFSYDAGADFGIGIFTRLLSQPYSFHIAKNSSEFISSVLNQANSIVVSFLSPALSLVTSLVMLVMISATLLVVSPVATISIAVFFGLIYGAMIWFSKKILARNGLIINEEYAKSLKTLQEGFGGIRDVLLDGTQDLYIKLFKRSEMRLRRAIAKNQIIAGCPKFIVEGLGLLFFIVLIVVFSNQQDSFDEVIPVIGFFALAAQRLLPLLQQGFASLSQIRGGQVSVSGALDLMDLPLPDLVNSISPLEFKKNIKLSDVFFKYSSTTPFVLRDINLEIKKGSRLGISGVTGGGKSTLLDLIMGLHLPSNGNIYIDDVPLNKMNQRAWQLNIAHVPQNIFIADTTIAENIAFGLSKKEIDIDRVRIAAKQACIDDTINSWKDGYDTRVGERGIWLSGGQRQRIGIARALYKNSSLLILDEATSALDYETESRVMNSIRELSPNLTILMVAHRLTTLNGCDAIIKLENGQFFIESTNP